MTLTRKQLRRILKQTRCFSVDGITCIPALKFIPQRQEEPALIGCTLSDAQTEQFSLGLLLRAKIINPTTIDVCGTRLQFFSWKEIQLVQDEKTEKPH